MKPIRASSLGSIMRCRAFLKVSQSALDSSSDAAKFGSAFALCQQKRRAEAALDYSMIQAQFGLTNDELDELRKLPYRIQRGFSQWELMPERPLGCNTKLEAVKPDDATAVLTGHPDVVAFHTIQRNCAQIIDDKTGQQEVLDCWQLIAYVCLVLANFPEIDYVDAQYDYYRLGFSSGRVNKDGKPMPFTRQEIMEKYWPRIVEAVKESRRRKNQTYTRGVQCDYCAKWVCPAWGEELAALRDPDKVQIPLLTAESTMAERAAFVLDWLDRQKAHKRIADALEEILKGIASQCDIDLGNDTYYGSKPQLRRSYSGTIALPKLLDLMKGNQRLLGEVLGAFTKTDIAEVCKRAVDEKFVDGKKGALIDKVLGELKSEGAELVKTINRVSVYPKQDVIGEAE